MNIDNMTDEEKRIAIAKACGAKIISKKFKRTDGWRTAHKWAWDGSEENPCDHSGGGLYGWGWNDEASPNELPDYLNSLDSMHEAEQSIPPERRCDYVLTLSEIATVGGDMGWGHCTATASQRAEAFLAILP